MAAGKFHLYTTAWKYFLEGRINLLGGAANGSAATVVKAMLLTDGYTPSTASHSALNQIAPASKFQSTASSTIVNAYTLVNMAVTGSGAYTVKFDADDIAGFSSDGSTIASAKYLALYAQSASNGAAVDNLLIGFMDLDTAAADDSAGNSTQVNITWASGGIFKVNTNP